MDSKHRKAHEVSDYRLFLDIEQPGKLKRLIARLSDWPDVESVSCYYSESLYRVQINITASQSGEALAIGITFSMEIFERGNITIGQLLDPIKWELEKAKDELDEMKGKGSDGYKLHRL